MFLSITHELRREWAFFLLPDHSWGFFVAIYDHFSLVTYSGWRLPGEVDAKMVDLLLQAVQRNPLDVLVVIDRRNGRRRCTAAGDMTGV